jgi:hypothetical protein
MKLLGNQLIIILLAFCWSQESYGQNKDDLQISINAGISSSGNLKYSQEYSNFSSSPEIFIENTSNTTTRNYNLGVGYQMTPSFIIQGSIGTVNYGFFYIGRSFSPSGSLSNIVLREKYNTKIMEVNLSGIYKYEISPEIQLLIQPGFSWYTNPNESRPQSLRIPQNSNNYSATLFSGLEFPVLSELLFINIGINAKVALSDFAFDFDFENSFFPYAIGIQSGINYRFNSKL